ncbi:unnamed protein product [Hermetia illucens]|uniref:Carboxylesterase type B domain-containing protein n=1 Tax=Hermetia illucens TaxID=343691 RepID=A0A7R8YRD7_HERIL|nr:glutactin-like [Hermetia illucens]CAD7081405.1 unnamed protein product [Hermetia illucens]
MVKLSWLLVVTVVVCYGGVSEARKKNLPKVDVTGYGTVQGVIKTTTWSERKYLKFKNIKYAASPERFKPSVPFVPGAPSNDAHITSSEEEREKDGVVNWYKSKNLFCPSLETLHDFNLDDIDEDPDMEDCLFLSVSTRNRTGNQPVMVYLAGYDVVRKESDLREAVPHYLLEKDVVLVAVQYRVGPFGFLSTMTEDMPGNVGVLDIIEALRWVQKYIKYFGGDPTRVTLFGQYHSAAIINALTMSPLCEKEPLFSQVIYQSGSALLDGIATDKPIECLKQMGVSLKCTSSDDLAQLAKCLKAAKPLDLLRAYSEYLDEMKEFPFLTVGGPSGVLTDFPSKLLENGNFRGYPTIGGSVKHPGVCNAMRDVNSTTFRTEYKTNLDSLKKLFESIGTKNEDQIKYVDEKFPNKIFFNNIFKAVLPAIIDIKGLDIKYATSHALKHNADKGAPSFLYAFNYFGFFSRLDCAKEVLNDVSLADDSIYLFPYPEKVENLTWKDIKMAKFMVNLWTSFAATGSPSAPGLHKWPILEKGNFGPYLGIDFIYKMGFDYSQEYFVTLKDQMKSINIYDNDV